MPLMSRCCCLLERTYSAVGRVSEQPLACSVCFQYGSFVLSLYFEGLHVNIFIPRMSATMVSMCSFSVMCCACGPSLYHLPSPAVPEDVVVVDLEGGADERVSTRQYLEVRHHLLELYNFLSSQRYAEAAEYLSLETHEFLKRLVGVDSIVEALSHETITLDGRTVAFDPVVELLAENLEVIKDEVDGIEEQETERRKEIFVSRSEGPPLRLVFIREGSKWVLHRTRLRPR
jgi:hypothetical protein